MNRTTALKKQLEQTELEIQNIKTERIKHDSKGFLISPKYKTRRLSQLIGIRSSLQANVTRAEKRLSALVAG